ncbi:hypothetical protein TTHERM_000473299 (macronuclear) [Tetrahymena thermophila SB210]|uniref:Uncharacterized protein n=1 Tax=Tetrahymena thermophila (strain SB210) TaxID=312017 RepID=W7X3K6_TETTS|nr:hypothetical protein TTHERM_000473299 [Tetrahymena thermophila SB210]EWS72042.1 hypothetical protein TTHERM_000473299 [Tetrahymena thermophila SB210]|eukprot:XP_012655417.1 hypothetical protein TTHERM_000473299 [Tetrahymena thermophila SB210]
MNKQIQCLTYHQKKNEFLFKLGNVNGNKKFINKINHIQLKYFQNESNFNQMFLPITKPHQIVDIKILVRSYVSFLKQIDEKWNIHTN